MHDELEGPKGLDYKWSDDIYLHKVTKADGVLGWQQSLGPACQDINHRSRVVSTFMLFFFFFFFVFFVW